MSPARASGDNQSATGIADAIIAQSTSLTPKLNSRIPTRLERIQATRELKHLLKTYDHESAVDLYLDGKDGKGGKYAHCRPHTFKGKTAKQVQELFDDETSWLYRLWLLQYYSLIDLRWNTLHAHHLGLPPWCADPALFLVKENIKRWEDAIQAAYPGAPLKWFLEVGWNGRIHAHLFSDHRRCVSERILRASKSRKVALPIRDEKTLKNKAKYSMKSPLHWPTPKYPDRRHVVIWAEATQRGRLPQTSGVKNIPKTSKIMDQVGNPSYVPGRITTPGVWEEARAYFDACVSATTVPAIHAADVYLETFPDCPPDPFNESDLSFNGPNLTAFISFCRTLNDLPRAVDNFSGKSWKSGKRQRTLFWEYRFNPGVFRGKLERRERYHEWCS